MGVSGRSAYVPNPSLGADDPGCCPKRPVRGFATTRREVSGRRLWGLARAPSDGAGDGKATRPGCASDRAAGAFFARVCVYNFCPVSFMAASGANVVPEKLPKAVRKELLAHCDKALDALVATLEPRACVGVGKWAHKRVAAAVARLAAKERLLGVGSGGGSGAGAAEGGWRAADVVVGSILHPSPASPAANKGWAEKARAQLQAMGAWKYWSGEEQ